MTAPFPVGASVRVVSLGRTGEVVEAGRGGRYRVRVGGVVLSCRQDDLQPQDKPATTRRRNRPSPPRERAETGTNTHGRAQADIDLHGFTVEQALDAVTTRLDAALRDGLHHLDIIHGRGSGRIKIAVHRLLREVSAVQRFEVLKENPGVTRVFF